jgi:hypothetical protein
MDDNEVIIRYKQMELFFAPKKLPDPIHQPMQFGMYVRMYNFYKERQKGIQQ